MRCDIIDRNGYVCTMDTVKQARSLVRQVQAGCNINVYISEIKTDRLVMEPIVIRPEAVYHERSENYSLTGCVDKRVTKKDENSQPIIELDGFKLIEETV